MDTDFLASVLNGIYYLWIYKVQIIAGYFSALTIYSYFYKKKKASKKKEEIFSKIENIIKMGEAEKYQIKEIVNDLKGDFKSFKAEVRSEFKEIYVLIASLKTDTSLNSLRITMYVSIAIFIISSVLSLTIK